MRVQRSRSGFTLLELMITMVLLSILATMAMQLLWRAKDRSIEATLQTDLKSLAVQQEAYFGRNFVYALTLSDINDLHPSPGVQLTINYAASDGWGGSAAHLSAPMSCGLLIGEAPGGMGGPATLPGVVMCTGP